MRMILTGLLLTLAWVPILAQAAVQLQSLVYVERLSPGRDGHERRMIEPVSSLSPGDRVVTMLHWQAAEADLRRPGGFTVTSPVPSTLLFQRSADDASQVSVDGGHHWGLLGRLRIAEGAETRLASPEDVTHLRWRIPPRQAAQGSGTITYSAIVR